MKRAIIYWIILVFICSPALSFAQSVQERAPRFFSAFEDVPLMDGMVELPDHITTYDKPQGRIIESVALMNDSAPDKVRYFYRMTLPQMGWGVVSDTRYFRKDEYLDLSFEVLDGMNVVKVMIRPAL